MSFVPQELAGFAVPKVVHTTWAKTFVCHPELYFQPSTLEEIQLLVKSALKHQKTIMTVGSGHSPSDMTMSDEWLLNLDKYSSILKVDEHDMYTDVTVEAGIRVYQLNELLAKKGLAIQNLGSISEQSMGGIISTGTHGASPLHGLVSQQLVDITLVNGLGEVVKCSPTDKPELFRAAMLSLGKIGIIAQLTIRTVPRYAIKSYQEVISFKTLLDIWETVWTSDEFVRVWWFPYSKRCVLWRASKSVEEYKNPRSSWYGTKWGRLTYEFLLWVCVHVYPKLTPIVERFIFSKQYGNKETLGHGTTAVQESVEGLNMDCLFSQYVNEWAAPLNNGPEILRSLERSIDTAAHNGDFFVHAPIEVRCSNTTYNNEVGEPDVSHRHIDTKGPVIGNNLRPYLDTTPELSWVPKDKITNSQLTLYINATMYRPFRTSVPIGKWYRIFESSLEAAGGKPHWAKNFIGSEEWAGGELKSDGYKDGEMKGFAVKMRDWYGDDLVKFNQVRREQDPNGVFCSGRSWAVRNGIII
ncbi:D-arabinono-1,4-lactone oxidase [Komagataella phaffii CBS 7435]|uniref:D-arabinono-1,4-lactone oxidase n=2 Tax=Komagataella phaffii TaxID=460519 RepID=C4QZY1_KOMPG|nr:D-Arabinono-1,4-lactone oxidase, catalyzes the final step in biosynthesis of D-erythroascorbic acid [Komagataella phaffii GS115]AOA62955.1 GQ67_00225T0 [Komagataella phaffii]CAH2448695.1 D-arabinono-1,4-lactone oxidase [Komagataella phaffii CBS 7435]AOA67830.1 GQ68_01163T0 [Komagataella phaffii GS115]CAY68805.1 D-Arabinono-1,4-lactone oxidase, catalyzes the final step in biosynthesis of D-erythroascorbic acid [Komagataella phaffii GS115]CCA38787.1 D-arabinono-1,4-lactone oxidase [Komagatael